MDQVLVIDDDTATLGLIVEILNQSGYKVFTATNGEEGIKILCKDVQFRLIISDINMPKMDGNKVAEYIRSSQDLKNLPIIAMTGSTSDVKKELFDNVLEKPFGFEQIINAFRSLT